MNLQQYVHALRKFWWVPVLTTVLGVGYGMYVASSAVSQYRTTVTFFVVAESADISASAAVQGDQFAQRRVNSYVALLSTDRLAKRIAERDDIGAGPAEVRRMLGASGDLDTVLLTASVTSRSAALAAAVGDAVAEEFVDFVEEIEGGSNVRLEVVSGPSTRELPTRTALTGGIRAAVGLLLGLGIALVLELRDHAIRSEEQLREVGGKPVLGKTPVDRRVTTSPLLMDVDPSSTFAESVRQLRTNLQFMGIDAPMQVIMVTSSVSQEGKSVTTGNLALSLAQSGYKTLAVDADLRRPMLGQLFGTHRFAGLTDVLIGRSTIDATVRRWHKSLDVLPSGALPPNPTELLAGQAMSALMQELRGSYDVIVIDTPPLLPVADAQVVSAHVDGVILAVRAGRASRNQVSRSVRALDSVSAPLLGTVLTVAPAGRRVRYERYERYDRLAPTEMDVAPVAPPGSTVTSFGTDGLNSPRRPGG